MDYITVNFHTDNFAIVDKVIDVLAPLSDVGHILRNELCDLRSDAYTLLSYGYAVHVRKGVDASEETEVHSHQPQEHEAQQFAAYQELDELNSLPDLFDEPATQEAFINQVRHQLSLCAEMSGSVLDQSE